MKLLHKIATKKQPTTAPSNDKSALNIPHSTLMPLFHFICQARGLSGAVCFDLSVLPIKMSLAADVCSLWVQSAAQIKSINLRASDDQH